MSQGERSASGSYATPVLMPGGGGYRWRPKSGMTLLRLLLLLVAIALGAVAGYLDITSLRVLPSLAFLAAASFVLGMIRPANAWLYALVMALAVPVMHLLSTPLGLEEARPPKPNVAVTLLGIAPALAGALIGVFVHRGLFGSPSPRHRRR